MVKLKPRTSINVTANHEVISGVVLTSIQKAVSTVVAQEMYIDFCFKRMGAGTVQR